MKIKQGIKNYEKLISLIEINLLVRESDSHEKLMTLSEMQETINEIIGYENNCELAIRGINKNRDEIGRVKDQTKLIRLDTDSLDSQIEAAIKRYRTVSRVNQCIIL